MPRGFETYVDAQGAIVSSGSLANRDISPREDMEGWIEAVEVHYASPLTARRGIDNRSIPGLQSHMEMRARQAIGHCSLGAECRLSASLPGMEEGVLQDGRLVLRCPAQAEIDHSQRPGNGTDRLRCHAFHNGAPRKLAAFITEAVTAYTAAIEQMREARQNLGRSIQNL